MSYGAECLAKIKKLFGLTELSGQKRRADDTDIQEAPKLAKYRRVTDNFTDKPLPGVPATEYAPRRSLKAFYHRLKPVKRSDNVVLSAMGSHFSNHKTHNNIEAQPHMQSQQQQQQQQRPKQRLQYNDYQPTHFNNNHTNTTDLSEDDEDEIMFLQQQHQTTSTSKKLPTNSLSEQIRSQNCILNQLKPLPNHMKPLSLKRNKFSRIPDLHPIIKPTSSRQPSSTLLTNGTTLAKPNTVLINGSSSRLYDDCGDFRSSFSLRKNILSSKPISSIFQDRSIAPFNSIGPRQHNLEEKRNYEELLRNLVPGFGTDSNDDKTLPISSSKRLPHEVSQRSTASNRKRTDTEIFQDLRNSEYFADEQAVAKIEPVNTMRSKVHTKPEFQDVWLDNLNQKYSGMKLQMSESIMEEKMRVEQIRRETKENEKIYKNRMAKDWHVQDIIVIDDTKEEEEVEFPEITAEMSSAIMKAVKGPVSQVLIEKFNIKITCFDIETLYWEPDFHWLNDEVINFYMNLIMERSEQRGNANGWPKVHVMNTFFIPRLTQGGYSVVRRWTRKVDIFSYDLMPIPVHVGGVHWTLAMVDFKQKTVKYYDSMGSPNQQVLDLLKSYLREESREKRKMELDLSQWHFESATNIPRQGNGSDCGVFTCMFAEYITRNKPITFSQKHMHYFRMKMIYEICNGKLMF